MQSSLANSTTPKSEKKGKVKLSPLALQEVEKTKSHEGPPGGRINTQQSAGWGTQDTQQSMQSTMNIGRLFHGELSGLSRASSDLSSPKGTPRPTGKSAVDQRESLGDTVRNCSESLANLAVFARQLGEPGVNPPRTMAMFIHHEKSVRFLLRKIAKGRAQMQAEISSMRAQRDDAGFDADKRASVAELEGSLSHVQAQYQRMKSQFETLRATKDNWKEEDREMYSNLVEEVAANDAWRFDKNDFEAARKGEQHENLGSAVDDIKLRMQALTDLIAKVEASDEDSDDSDLLSDDSDDDEDDDEEDDEGGEDGEENAVTAAAEGAVAKARSRHPTRVGRRKRKSEGTSSGEEEPMLTPRASELLGRVVEFFHFVEKSAGSGEFGAALGGEGSSSSGDIGTGEGPTALKDRVPQGLGHGLSDEASQILELQQMVHLLQEQLHEKEEMIEKLESHLSASGLHESGAPGGISRPGTQRSLGHSLRRSSFHSRGARGAVSGVSTHLDTGTTPATIHSRRRLSSVHDALHALKGAGLSGVAKAVRRASQAEMGPVTHEALLKSFHEQAAKNAGSREDRGPVLPARRARYASKEDTRVFDSKPQQQQQQQEPAHPAGPSRLRSRAVSVDMLSPSQTDAAGANIGPLPLQGTSGVQVFDYEGGTYRKSLSRKSFKTLSGREMRGSLANSRELEQLAAAAANESHSARSSFGAGVNNRLAAELLHPSNPYGLKPSTLARLHKFSQFRDESKLHAVQEGLRQRVRETHLALLQKVRATALEHRKKLADERKKTTVRGDEEETASSKPPRLRVGKQEDAGPPPTAAPLPGWGRPVPFAVGSAPNSPTHLAPPTAQLFIEREKLQYQVALYKDELTQKLRLLRQKQTEKQQKEAQEAEGAKAAAAASPEARSAIRGELINAVMKQKAK
uniref:Uncharacterized protein n=1 Tax=Chromera velia CCMP2878 TaxID=1169474 RepID=A0A0G4F537_9ALVE|eukprot:Cvel_2713.t1-p1 / transcript=Cvel_2713.t1 / gene=Cvel_2713 / organism=Chromera_velia_CCMP2878 / gene_product=hypothetical protein / transcript_product=hypothetical protein / location=Cvel_scaffold109:17913-22070(+) / protein_length=915 / sequence_SO=supercontig / SO=protein_coding / is_pseudo=false